MGIGAKLDHVITWNLPPERSAGVLGTSWRNVGTEIPEGCMELEHPELAQHLARTVTLEKHVWESLRIQGITAQSVERVCVLIIGTRFSNLYTAVDTPADAA